jgi:type IV pilus assembly protein PilQ
MTRYIIFLFFIFSLVFSEEIASIGKIETKIEGNVLSIIIPVSDKLTYKEYRSIKPFGIVFEFTQAKIDKKEVIPINKANVKNISITQKEKNVAILIELEKQVEYDVMKLQNALIIRIKSETSIEETKPQPIHPVIKPKPTIKPKPKPIEEEESEEPKKFEKGNLDQLVDFDFHNADIIPVLKTIAEQIGYNLIVTKSVSGTFTAKLNQVPLKLALKYILNQLGLTYVIEENTIKVGSASDFIAEETQDKPITKVFKLSFAKADVLQASVKTVLSPKGSIQVDARTNQLIITDTPAKLEQAEEMIKKLDTKTKQVSIEAAVVAVRKGKTQQFGIDWSVSGSKTFDETSTTGEAKISPPLVYPGATGKISIGVIAKDTTWNAVLSALQRSEDAKILATPNVLVLDNETARINSTQNFLYVSGVSAVNPVTGSVTYTYGSVQTGVSLEVTPQVNPEGYVTMIVKPTVSSIADPGPPPATDTRSVETKVLVKDGQTLVIGGLLRDDEVVTISEVPVIAKIPILGMLFKSEAKQKVQNELIIFITPHIVVVE